jgi:hypothetical protein
MQPPTSLSLAAFVLCMSSAALACGSSQTTPSKDADAAGGGGDPGETDGGTDAPDGAAPGIPGELVNSFAMAEACGTFCKRYGFVCTNTCKIPGGGTGAGGVYYGVEGVTLATCETPVPTTRDGGALSTSECCCDAPHTTLVDGPMPPKSCNTVCAAAGLRCDPSAWRTYPKDDAVGERTYGCSGDRTGAIERCDEVVGLSLPNTTCTLRSYYCSCVE